MLKKVIQLKKEQSVVEPYKYSRDLQTIGYVSGATNDYDKRL
jgi:hypothetical protein